MIKLGDAYFDEASIVAIQPCDVSIATSYLVHVAGGGFYQWTAGAAEVQRKLEEVGLIAPASLRAENVFTEEELVQLVTSLAGGYYYAAKDEDGRVYAFSEAPLKGKHSWINDDGKSDVIRLTAGEYTALSFADEDPLDIAVALERVLRC